MSEQEQNIDWKKWESDRFVKLTAGRPKVLTLTSAKETTNPIKQKDTGSFKDVPCVVFKVIKEDDKEVEKEYSVTSRKLVNKLKPIIMKGFPATVKITSFGTGFDTEFEVEEIMSSTPTDVYPNVR